MAERICSPASSSQGVVMTVAVAFFAFSRATAASSLASSMPWVRLRMMVLAWLTWSS